MLMFPNPTNVLQYVTLKVYVGLSSYKSLVHQSIGYEQAAASLTWVGGPGKRGEGL